MTLSGLSGCSSPYLLWSVMNSSKTTPILIFLIAWDCFWFARKAASRPRVLVAGPSFFWSSLTFFFRTRFFLEAVLLVSSTLSVACYYVSAVVSLLLISKEAIYPVKSSLFSPFFSSSSAIKKSFLKVYRLTSRTISSWFLSGVGF